jgi:hypothetical protein
MLRAGPKTLTCGFVVRSVRERARDFAGVLNLEPAGLSLPGDLRSGPRRGAFQVEQWFMERLAVSGVLQGCSMACIRGASASVSGVVHPWVAAA